MSKNFWRSLITNLKEGSVIQGRGIWRENGLPSFDLSYTETMVNLIGLDYDVKVPADFSAIVATHDNSN
jgi:hypothetical protein